MGLALGMNRSILLSLTTIGAVVGLFASAATFAAFTSSDTESGSVTAGSVAINVQGDVAGTATDGLTFLPPTGPGCPTVMAPGETCSETAHVTNGGTLPVSLSAPTATITLAGAAGACSTTLGPLNDWDVTFGAYVFEGAGPILNTTAADPADDSATFPITVSLNAGAQTGCQGATATVFVTVTGSNP